MTGPEHYSEAEHMLRMSAEMMVDYAKARPGTGTERAALNVATAGLASAQVHATLALTAATAPNSAVSIDSLSGSVEDGWAAVLS